ncbi:MAG TPA: hypothetical protein VK212_09390 [Lentimicrobium sp.]|nr:hypothetical protein [Lentimicrobium sp.]
MNKSIKVNSTAKTSAPNKEMDEIKRILNSLSESLQQARYENEYVGETKILMIYSKKNRAKFITSSFEQGLDNLLKNNKPSNKEFKNTDILLPQLQKQQGYIRISPPKN